MTHEEENKKILHEISNLKAENDKYRIILQSLEEDESKKQIGQAPQRTPPGVIQMPSIMRNSHYTNQGLKTQLKHLVDKNENRIKSLEHRLKQNSISRSVSDFFDKNPVEYVGGRTYRGTFLGLIVFRILQIFAAIVIIFIIAMIAGGIGSIFK